MSNPKRTLPLLNAVTIHVESALTRPHIEQARRSLGGSASECASAGRVVEVEVAPGVRKNGVVLCTMDGTVDVWFGDRSVRRSPASRVSPANVDTSAMSDELLSASTDARIIAWAKVQFRKEPWLNGVGMVGLWLATMELCLLLDFEDCGRCVKSSDSWKTCVNARDRARAQTPPPSSR
jgi:hypothetical protein